MTACTRCNCTRCTRDRRPAWTRELHPVEPRETPRTPAQEEAYWAQLRASYEAAHPGELARRDRLEREQAYRRAFGLVGRIFTLDGFPLTNVIRWAIENDLTLREVEAIAALDVGGTYELGGGAAATFEVARVE